jgi:NAD(P)-dependent dehydrogenase (short-subunit alcohol dehydrogenase family)
MSEDRPVILITGAGHGLGAAIARAMKDFPVQLVLCSRTRSALEAVDDEVGGAVLVPMDFRKPEQIDTLAGGLMQRFQRLDALIACHVEMLDLTPVAHLEPKTLNSMLTVNLIATHRLIRGLDPLFRQSSKPAAMFMTCDAGRSEGKAFWGALAACKAGLEAMVEAYRVEVAKSGIEVMLHDPGPLPTASRKRAFPGEDPKELPDLDQAAQLVIDRVLADRTDWRHA